MKDEKDYKGRAWLVELWIRDEIDTSTLELMSGFNYDKIVISEVHD